MSVLFLPPPSASAIPDASETVSGKIRIATSAEATAGTNDLTAITPLKLKSVVDAAVVGGVTYQGTFDASAPADLSNATKGDLYIISVAGTYQGQTWAVGDHLLINADMGGTLDPAKIDKVDNTDSVTSVAGRTGAVTLSTADISGLATVATTGAYSDLTGTPTLATVATTGAYSDLSGTPTNVSTFTNDAGYLTAITGESIGDLSDVTLTTPSAGQGLVYNGTLSVFENATITATVSALNDIGDVSAASPNNGDVIAYNSTSGDWEAGAVSASVAALDDIGDVTITSVADGQFLKYDSVSGDWVNGDSGLYEAYTTNLTGSLTAPDQPKTLSVRVTSPASQTLTLFSASADLLGTTVSLVNINAGEWTISAASGDTITGLSSAPTLSQNQSLILSLVSVGVWFVVAYEEQGLDSLADVSITSPSNGEALIYNSTSGDWENGTVSASVAALNDIGDVNAPTPANTNVIKYNSTSGDWESGAVAASEVSGLATVAATGAYSDLSGTPTNVSTFTNDAGYLTEANSVVLQYNSTTTATAVSTKDLHVYRLYGAGGFTLTVSSSVSNSLVLINNISGSACTIAGPLFRLNGEGVAGGSTSITVEAGERRLFYLESSSTWLETNATLLDRLAGVSITSPSNGEALIYNSTSGDWENGTVSASVAALNDIGDVSAAAPSNNNVIKYNSTSGDWESGAVAYSEVTGTPTLGTAAALDVGTSATNVVQLDGSARLPAVDGSQLTNLPTGGSVPSVTSATPGASYTISTSTGIEEAYLLTPSAACAVTIPTATSAGSGYKYQIKNLSANAVTISPSSGTIDGSASFALNVQYATVTLLSDGSNWFVI